MFNVLQAAIFRIGICAEFGGSVFRPLVGGNFLSFGIVAALFRFIFSLNYECYYLFCSSAEALSRLDVVIRHPDALHSENAMAYDNAVSALGKICQFHCDNIDAAQVLSLLVLFCLILLLLTYFQLT